MSTPTFKLLLNALRLGQPQDPQAAIFALVEALSAQEELIDDLRRKLQVVQSATQILEIRFVKSSDATTAWGTGHMGGVIHVIMKR